MCWPPTRIGATTKHMGPERVDMAFGKCGSSPPMDGWHMESWGWLASMAKQRHFPDVSCTCSVNQTQTGYINPFGYSTSESEMSHAIMDHKHLVCRSATSAQHGIHLTCHSGCRYRCDTGAAGARTRTSSRTSLDVHPRKWFIILLKGWYPNVPHPHHKTWSVCSTCVCKGTWTLLAPPPQTPNPTPDLCAQMSQICVRRWGPEWSWPFFCRPGYIPSCIMSVCALNFLIKMSIIAWYGEHCSDKYLRIAVKYLWNPGKLVFLNSWFPLIAIVPASF